MEIAQMGFNSSISLSKFFFSEAFVDFLHLNNILGLEQNEH